MSRRISAEPELVPVLCVEIDPWRCVRPCLAAGADGRSSLYDISKTAYHGAVTAVTGQSREEKKYRNDIVREIEFLRESLKKSDIDIASFNAHLHELLTDFNGYMEKRAARKGKTYPQQAQIPQQPALNPQQQADHQAWAAQQHAEQMSQAKQQHDEQMNQVKQQHAEQMAQAAKQHADQMAYAKQSPSHAGYHLPFPGYHQPHPGYPPPPAGYPPPQQGAHPHPPQVPPGQWPVNTPQNPVPHFPFAHPPPPPSAPPAALPSAPSVGMMQNTAQNRAGAVMRQVKAINSATRRH